MKRLSSASLMILLAGCTRMNPAEYLAPTTPGAGAGTTNGPSSTDLPCDVAGLLSNYCWSCHGTIPTASAPMSLVSHADLTAPSPTNPSVTNAQAALTRMQDTAKPMPPLPSSAVPADQIALFKAWLDGNAVAGTCAITSPYDTPTVCTSGTMAPGRDSGLMRPGEACISCHSSGEGPSFQLAGTVYPTAHEPNNCNGAAAIQVVITGAGGQTTTLTANSAGNFYASSRSSAISFPYTAKVVSNGKERVMSAAQSDGDCNGCHTETGANGAPGRIMAP